MSPLAPSDVLRGIVLPASVLQSPWFQLLAAFVAVNTLIYVGLTLLKLVTWPERLRLDKARGDVASLSRDPAAPASRPASAS